METGTFRDLKYLVRVPRELLEKNPAILFLHGAGYRGTNLDVLMNYPAFRQGSCLAKDDSPFLIFAPQCHADTWFDLFEQLRDFARAVCGDPRVDKERVYLMGASMGGYGTWQLGMSLPELFAAMIPICGGGMKWNAKRLASVPVWAVHGELDPAVAAEESIRLVDAVNQAGGSAKLTLLKGVGHNAWDYTFANQEMFDWLLQQKRARRPDETTNEFADADCFG